jgi:hypothetical protein
MKLRLVLACLLACSTVLAEMQQEEIYAHAELIAKDETAHPFQRYLATCFLQNDWSQAVYLAGFSENKPSSENDMTILSIELYPQNQETINHIFSVNPDVVHVSRVNFEYASQLYDILQEEYPHFIYVPDGKLFIASKYVLSLEELEKATIPTVISGLPATLTAIKRNYSPSYQSQRNVNASKIEMLGKNSTFKILPVRSRRDRDEKDDRPGGSVEFGAKGKWGDGEGMKWEGYVKAEGHDGKGNYAEGQVTQRDDGTGEIDFYGGHENTKE